ncbi:transcriptional regulator, GntR family [Actinomadura meyerae]|jgi:DNA-binding GntR family transcriptional regulator|uniref:Transcriptional regulator, GntR family n=1 Tax=Actinomadura meyerae TaxID=240840 RepID=A0A239MR01_9ACTN|nr:GntR family transcriptional regulator [Actinomadura meyerae]SNT45151.1 transcriptional regulator, GntR family [Actinomadura meyerae]
MTAAGSGGPALGRRRQLSDEVAAHVRDMIMSGQVRHGEFLRLERIAEDLGISVTPVREALLSLRGEGFVTLEPRRGFMPAPLTRQDVQDLFEAQAYFAGELAARAAGRAAETDLDALDRTQALLEQAFEAGDPEGVERANHQFHRLINLRAESPKTAWLLQTVVRYAPRRFYAGIEGWTRASVDDHRLVLAALRAGDAEAARQAMRAHIRHAGTLLVVHLEARGFWADEPE